MSSEETLVVGRDATTRALLCSAFARQGLRARVALDGVAALDVCQKRPPTTLIIEPNSEGDFLPNLLNALRDNVRLRRIGVILLGSEPTPDEALRIAALPLPAYGKDVVSLSRFLSADTAQGVLSLGDYNVLSFIRALCTAQVKGHLIFRRPLPTKIPEAQVTLSTSGIFCRAGHLQGKNALNRIAVWRRAQVVWRLDSIPKDSIPEEAIEPSAFLEASQYLAEVQSILATMPPDDIPLVLVSEKRPPASKVPGEVNTILNLCSEGLSLDAVLEEVPFRVLDSLRIIQRLFNLGILAKPSQPAPIPATSGEQSSPEPVTIRPIIMLVRAPGEPDEEPLPSKSTWPIPVVTKSAESALQDLEERVARTLEEDGDELDDPNISTPSSFEEFETPQIQTPTVSRLVLDEPLLDLEQIYKSSGYARAVTGASSESPETEDEELSRDTPVEGVPLPPKTRRWKLANKKK